MCLYIDLRRDTSHVSKNLQVILRSAQDDRSNKGNYNLHI